MLLVTGATGNFGSATVEAALGARVPVRAFVHSADKARALEARGIDVAVGDLGDPVATGAALRGVDRLVLIGPSTPALVALETQMIGAARTAGVQRVVKVSALSVGTAYQAGLGDLHAAAEAALRASGLEWTALRPAATMGTPFQVGWIERDALFAPCAAGTAAFCAPADVAALAVHILEHGGHGGKAYTVTGPQALGLEQIAAIVAKELGRPLRYEATTDDEYRERLDAAGAPRSTIDIAISFFGRIRAGMFGDVTATVETLLGRPGTTYAQWAASDAARALFAARVR